MVKREDVKPGFVIKVVKQMPGSGTPGPTFKGKIGINEKLEILTVPMNRGGMNIVRLRRRKTGETVEFLYAFVTNYCGKCTDDPVPSEPENGS